MQTVNVEADVE